MAFLVSPTPPLPIPHRAHSFASLTDYDNELYRVLRKYLAEVAFRVNDLVPKDGSEAMTGPLNMGGFAITNASGATFTDGVQTQVVMQPNLPGRQILIDRLNNTINAGVEYKTTSGSIYAGQGTANTFVVGSANNMTLTAFQWLTVDATKVGLVTGQLQFPSTQKPSTDQNTLDDYFEDASGITPTLTFGGGSTGITYAAQSCFLQKVGRWIHITGVVQLTNKGSSTGTANISLSGLPSGPASFAVPGSAEFLNMVGLTGGFSVALTGSTVFMRQSSATGVANLTDANFGNTSLIRFSFQYMTTS